jgi:hypothetical protein
MEQACADQSRENSLGDQIVKGFWGDGLVGHDALKGEGEIK